MALNSVQQDQFNEHGWLITDSLTTDETRQLRIWIDEIQQWDDSGKWLHYREMTEFGPKLCRTEYFTPFHAGLQELLTRGSMIGTATSLLAEPAVLYKEKINYKPAATKLSAICIFLVTFLCCVMRLFNAVKMSREKQGSCFWMNIPQTFSRH